ncbi:DUF4479 family protein [Barrientosiimonas marina]|uniref:YtpR family tRNA-binding protein n=1 Tax=Lentibacillus kimchii TaxID=1542911 RepID=A0ABW2UTE8_9BACI
MDVYYNQNGIGDVLIVPLKDVDHYDTSQNYGDITRITDWEGSVAGYNIFRASVYFDLHTAGKITMTEPLLQQMKEAFRKNSLNDPLDFDVSPKFVVGYVTDKSPHENADKLSVCQVNTGEATHQIVCGAPNVEAGQKVVVAKMGAVMPSGMVIKPTELRGVPSNGMICSQKELGLPDASEEKGIYVLDNAFTIGEPFEL